MTLYQQQWWGGGALSSSEFLNKLNRKQTVKDQPRGPALSIGTKLVEPTIASSSVRLSHDGLSYDDDDYIIIIIIRLTTRTKVSF